MTKTAFLKPLASTLVIGALCLSAPLSAVAKPHPSPRGGGQCSNADYVGKVVTFTELSLMRNIAYKGFQNSGAVYVQSNTVTPIEGRATLVVRLASTGRVVSSETERLVDGSAQIEISRNLPARRTYEVVAKYLPDACSIFRASHSNVQFYTVMPKAHKR